MKHKSGSSVDPLSYTIPNGAKALGISVSGIYRLINAGKLKPVTVAGRRLIPRQQLLRLLEEDK